MAGMPWRENGNLKKPVMGIQDLISQSCVVTVKSPAKEAVHPTRPLEPGARNWGCTRDNVTGLVWEIKAAAGLQASGNTYSWYNPDKNLNGGTAGSKNGGQCEESACDTRAFVEKINEQELCGLQ